MGYTKAKIIWKWGINKINRDELETIQPNYYLIPEDCVARIIDGVLAVKKRTIIEKKDRCHDCAMFMVGRSGREARFDRYVCKKKKKKGFNIFTLNELYEQVREYGLACPMFVRKKEKKST